MNRVVLSQKQYQNLVKIAHRVESFERIAVDIDNAGKLKVYEVSLVEKYRPVKISSVVEKAEGGDYGTAANEM